MKRLWLLAGLATVVFAGPVRAFADDGPVQIRLIEPRGHPTVSVTISDGPSLSRDDVRLTENGRPVRVLNIRPLLDGGQAIDVILAIDTSRSVRGAALEAARTAARQFASTLPPEVPIGIVTFSDRARLLTPVTADHQRVLEALDGLTETQRGTRLYDAVVFAAETFFGSAQHNVVLLTDGKDAGSHADLEAAATAAVDANVTVFTVGLVGSQTDFSPLSRLADATGGTFSEVSSPDLSGLYRDLAERLSHQYVILYQSTAPAGAQVTVSVMTPAGSDSSTFLVPLPRAAASPVGEDRPLFPGGTPGLIIALTLSFLAVFLLMTMALGASARARRDRVLSRRMAVPANAQGIPARPDHGPTAWMPEPVVHAADALAAAAGLKASLELKLERAGLAMTPGEVLTGAFVTGSGGLLLGGLAFRNVIIALLLAAIGASIPFVLLSRRVDKRLSDMNDQLPDILLTLASSMRAGHSFLQALDTVAKEIGEPAGPEFNRVVAEIRLGRRFEEAMTALGDRVGTEEFKWAVLAINVQREVGGNLAEVLDTLAETVRERDFIRRQVRVLSAEGRLSVKILIGMPFLLAAYLFWANPEYMSLLWTSRPGLFFIAIGGVLMIVGAVWARKVVRIDV